MITRRPYIFLSQVILCPFAAYHHDNKTPIHLIIAGHTTSGSGLVYSIQEPCMSSSPPSRPDSMRLAHKAQHTIRSHSAQVSNSMTMHVLWTLSQSLVSTPWGPLSTSSVSTSRHVVPSTQPICSPSRRGMLHSSSQVEESPSTVTPRLKKSSSTGHSSAILSQPAPDQTAHGPPQYHTTLAHVAPRRRVHYESVDQHAETPSDAGHSPSYTITPRDSSPVAGRRVDVACLYIDVAQ